MGPEQLDTPLRPRASRRRRSSSGTAAGRATCRYHLRMLDRGAYLGFDRFGLEILHPDRERLAVLIGLLGVGFERQLVLSHDTVWCWRGRAPTLPPEAAAALAADATCCSTVVPAPARGRRRRGEDRRRCWWTIRAATSPRRAPTDLLTPASACRITTQAFAPRPTVCASATRAPSTCRASGAPAELPGELDDLPQRRGAERLALREQAAARVHRQARAHRAAAVAHPARRRRRAGRVRAPRRRGSRAPASVSCTSTTSTSSGPRPALLVGGARRHARSASATSSLDEAGERRVLAEHRARQGASAARRPRRGPASAARGPRRDHDRRGALVGRAQHEQAQRIAHDRPTPSTSSSDSGLRYIAYGL